MALREALDLLMRCEPGSRVVAVGGDGTVNRWLPALRARRLELGLVPLGSGNDLARTLGPHRWPWPRALALRGPARPMDVGLRRGQGLLLSRPRAGVAVIGASRSPLTLIHSVSSS